jgi:hypothetical protein
LLSGQDIQEAKAWAARQPEGAPSPTALHFEFIKASGIYAAEQASQRERELAERERLVQQAEDDRAAREAAQREATEAAKREATLARTTARRTLAGLAAALVLALVAGGLGIVAWTKQKEAATEAQRAIAASRETKRLREETQITESGFLAKSASALVDDKGFGDAGTAMVLALEALPDKGAGKERPPVPEAQFQLDRAFRANRERAVLPHDGTVNSAAFSDAARIVTASWDRTARVWEAATGKELARLAHDSWVASACRAQKSDPEHHAAR